MGYKEALEANCRVVEFEEFGDYQGAWYAIVEKDDKYQLIGGGYGSCSGCDSFEDEFSSCYGEIQHEKLKKFGQIYLDDPLDLEVELTKVKEDVEWDMQSIEKLKWLKHAKKILFNNKFHNKVTK